MAVLLICPYICLYSMQLQKRDRECHLLTTGLSSKQEIWCKIFMFKVFIAYLYIYLYVCVRKDVARIVTQPKIEYSRMLWINCREEIQRIKAGNPDISHREAFSAAAKNVRPQKLYTLHSCHCIYIFYHSN